jgi:hypothetical protein
MPYVMLSCPQCDNEIGIPVVYENPEWDTGYPGGYMIADDEADERWCTCLLTDEQTTRLVDTAVEIANEGYFVPSDPDEGMY